MDKHQQIVDLVKAQTAAYNAQDFDAMRAGYTDDVVLIDLGVGIHRQGAENLIASARSTAAGFPDRRFEIEQILVDGDQAVMEATWTGTPADASSGAPDHWHTAGPDKLGPFRVCRVIKTRDGRIASFTDYTLTIPQEPGQA